jgi:hypothetical protein
LSLRLFIYLDSKVDPLSGYMAIIQGQRREELPVGAKNCYK